MRRDEQWVAGDALFSGERKALVEKRLGLAREKEKAGQGCITKKN